MQLTVQHRWKRWKDLYIIIQAVVRELNAIMLKKSNARKSWNVNIISGKSKNFWKKISNPNIKTVLPKVGTLTQNSIKTYLKCLKLLKAWSNNPFFKVKELHFAINSLSISFLGAVLSEATNINNHSRVYPRIHSGCYPIIQ